MKDLIEKLSTYNIFNYLLPGIVFVAITESLTKYNFIQEDIVIGVFLYCFIGLVIGRVGSILIELILKWIKFFKFSGYRDYVGVSNKDKIIELLSEANNMYINFFSLFLSIALLKIFEAFPERFQFLNDMSAGIAIAGLLLLFAFSYRKQNAYITKRVAGEKDKE